MSTCINKHGEYSDHVIADTIDPERFVCQRCFALDEDGLFAALAAAESDLRVIRALVHSDDADRYRDEACRGVVELPYASNRYVRLLDGIRSALTTEAPR